MLFNRQIFAIAMFATSCVLPDISLAQNSLDDEAIEEIQVTATRRPVSADSVSAALTIIDAEKIAAAKLATDSLLGEPGVFLQQTTPGQGAAIIRGLKGSEVLHLVDGMRLNNAIFRNAPTQYLGLVAPGTLDRIEIVRGAPASLYGSDAVGGVVQALSRFPAFDAPGTRRNVYFGFDTADLTRLARASVEAGDGTKAMLLSGQYLKTGNRQIGGGARIAPSGYTAKGGRAAFTFTPDDDERWLLDLQFASQPMTPRVDELVAGFGQAEPSSSEFFFAPNERTFVHGGYEKQSGAWNLDWDVDLAWQRIDDDRISRGFQSNERQREQNRSDLFGLTINASSAIENGSWLVGAEIYHDDVASARTEEDLLNGGSAQLTPRFPDGSTMDQLAVYGNVLRSIGHRHTLSGGLRVSAVKVDLPASPAIAQTSVEQRDVSADVGWVFDATEHTSLRANMGYGFRAPNVFDLGTLGERPGNRFNIPNANLKSERITQLDVGARYATDSVYFDAVLFGLHYTDRITSAFTGDVTASGRNVTQSQNAETADIFGIELSTDYQPSDRWSFQAVLNYTRGELEEVGGLTVAGDRIPPLNGRATARYRHSDVLRFHGSVLFADRQDRLSPRDVRDNRINPAGTAGWGITNIGADWNLSDEIDLSVTIENLLDKRYRRHGSGIDSVGRNLFLSLQGSW